MKIPNLELLENIDNYINTEQYEILKKITPLNETELINMKIGFINLYVNAAYNNKPTNIRKYSKLVSESTIEYVSLFMNLSNKTIELHNRKEVLEKSKIGGDFILNIIKLTNIKRFENNGKIIKTFKNGKNIESKSYYENKEIRTLQKYENLLKRLKYF